MREMIFSWSNKTGECVYRIHMARGERGNGEGNGNGKASEQRRRVEQRVEQRTTESIIGGDEAYS